MKMIKISSIILVGAMLFNSSCKKTFYTDVNHNPNAPAVVTPATLLSTVEGSLGYSIGGNMSLYTSIFMQQVNGIGNQAQAYNNYIFTGQDVDNLWANMYTSVMLNDNVLMQAADAKGYNVYSGVSRVLMAYSLQTTIDCWGKVPFSTAFQGFGKLQPTYDDDQALYASILKMCDSAIVFLKDSTPGALVPGAEDVIYGGSVDNWIKFAHAIKARIYMHQLSLSGTNAASALAEIALSFSSNADNAVYKFGTASSANNAWYQFINQRAGYVSFATAGIATKLLASNDPRFTFMIDTTAANGSDNLAAYYGAPDAVTEFITYDELQFMTAEALNSQSGSISAIQAAYQSGIMASMQKLGVDATSATAYISANGTLTTANAKSKIANEEYIALFLNPEAWTLWRRTGFPALVPTTTSSNIPRRLLYPQSEYSYNAANVPASTMYTTKIFWDK